MEETIIRIRQMERGFDCLLDGWARSPEAVKTDPEYQALLQTLIRYYESPLWLQDYRADELGLLPPDLKRGILSQDGFYNFLLVYHNQEEPL